MRRPALIFDFGNVVAFFDYTIACSRLGAPLGLDGAEVLSRIRAGGLSGLIVPYERGAMSAEDFSAGLSQGSGLDFGHEAFAAAWADIFRINEPVALLVAALKKAGYTLVLGSNTNDLHAPQFRSQFAEELSAFDALILSHEVGHIKPTADFYAACVEATGLPAADCVFIDDLPENVAGAVAAGLTGVLYRDDAMLRSDLAALGVEVGL